MIDYYNDYYKMEVYLLSNSLTKVVSAASCSVEIAIAWIRYGATRSTIISLMSRTNGARGMRNLFKLC